MSNTTKKFIEKLGWKVTDDSWDGNAHIFNVEEPDNLEEKFETLRLAFKKITDIGVERVFPMLRRAGDELVPVSYTHLTLPTIYSV